MSRSQRASKSVSSILPWSLLPFLHRIPPSNSSLTPGMEYDWGLYNQMNSFFPKFLLAMVLSQQQKANQNSKEFSSFSRYSQGPHHTVICNVKFCSLLTVLHIAGFFILVVINLFFIYSLSPDIKSQRTDAMTYSIFQGKGTQFLFNPLIGEGNGKEKESLLNKPLTIRKSKCFIWPIPFNISL